MLDEPVEVAIYVIRIEIPRLGEGNLLTLEIEEQNDTEYAPHLPADLLDRGGPAFRIDGAIVDRTDEVGEVQVRQWHADHDRPVPTGGTRSRTRAMRSVWRLTPVLAMMWLRWFWPSPR